MNTRGEVTAGPNPPSTAPPPNRSTAASSLTHTAHSRIQRQLPLCNTTNRTSSATTLTARARAHAITDDASPLALLSTQSFAREQCTRVPQWRPPGGREVVWGVVTDIGKLSVGREDYYVREVAENREEYLSGHGESPGRWLGKGAEALGQQGTASSEAFRRIFHGRHPDTGELLGRPHGQRGLPAFDVVFRPVKSVSVLYGLGDTRIGGAVAAAHQQAVVEALGYLEDHVGGRRGHAGARKVDGRGLLAVGFDHRTSRAGDPLLHTHVIVANRVQGPDGRWTALDGRDLWD